MDVSFARQLVDILSGMQLRLVPYTPESMAALVSELFREAASSPAEEQALVRRLQSIEPGCVYIMGSRLDLQCALFYHREREHYLLVGPCRAGTQTEEEAARLLRRLGMREERARGLVRFFRQQPVVPYERLLPLAQLLAQQLSGSDLPLPYERIDYLWQGTEAAAIPEQDTARELEQVRRVEERYAASAAMTEAVKQGNLSLAYRFIQRMHAVPEDLVRTHNSLRNAQNLCIILNTQLRHALEEEGVSPYRLDQISGGIARQIEKFKSISGVNAFYSEILSQYCALAREREQQGLSHFGQLAVTYIKSHLSDNLTVKDAAKALLMNPDYLSARFHQEVGMPFIQYVNRERVHQAAALLKRTDMQIQQISSAVGYNNTSYFSKQFVRIMGMTPRAYRGSGA